jgi:hypothetical protein
MYRSNEKVVETVGARKSCREIHSARHQVETVIENYATEGLRPVIRIEQSSPLKWSARNLAKVTGLTRKTSEQLLSFVYS